MAPQRVSKTIDEKRLVIELIENEGGGVPTRALQHFKGELRWKVSGAQIRYWWKHRAAIASSPSQALRLCGAGVRPKLGDLEDVIFDQILYLRTKKEKVARQWVQEQAQLIARDDLNAPDVGASDMWLAGFMARYGLSVRRTTNLTVLDDSELVLRAVRFLSHLVALRQALDPPRTLLMDETAVYFEDPRRDTIDMTGARHVVLRSSGFASMRITVALAVTAAGVRLPPLVIWKGKSETIEKCVGVYMRWRLRAVASTCGGVYVALQERSWMNSTLLTKWVDLVFPAVLDACGGRRLVWDSMRAHVSREVKAKCEAKGIKMAVVPGGLTPYLQAGDIGIFRSFKERLSPLVDEWKRSDRVLYTKAGNPRSPSVDEVITWVSAAWEAVPVTVMLRSIAAAGFSSDYRDWHIASHDVYGSLFRRAWLESDAHDDDAHGTYGDLTDEVDELVIE